MELRASIAPCWSAAQLSCLDAFAAAPRRRRNKSDALQWYANGTLQSGAAGGMKTKPDASSRLHTAGAAGASGGAAGSSERTPQRGSCHVQGAGPGPGSLRARTGQVHLNHEVNLEWFLFLIFLSNWSKTPFRICSNVPPPTKLVVTMETDLSPSSDLWWWRSAGFIGPENTEVRKAQTVWWLISLWDQESVLNLNQAAWQKFCYVNSS